MVNEIRNVTLSLFSFVLLSVLSVPSCVSYDFSVPKKVSGQPEVFVIAVQFPNKLASIEISTIEKRVFYEMVGYYQNVSYGKVFLTGNISTTWITLPHNMSYYGDYDNRNDHSMGARALIEDAVESIDKSINFSNFDFVFVVHTGGDEADSQEVTDIWSWGFWEGLSVQTNDGVVFNQGAVVSEFNSLGVFCHEFGHVIGLPDLYNYDRESSESFVGDWCLMGYGCHIGVSEGSKPSHITSWGKIFLGWINHTEIFEATLEHTENVIIQPLEELSAGIKTIKVRITNKTYYLIEVRTDEDLPDQGVLVTFVDETKNSGEGIVKVVDLNLSTSTLHDVTLHVGDIFEETQNNFTLKVLKRFENSSFAIKVSNKLVPHINVIVPSRTEAIKDVQIRVGIVDHGGTTLQGLMTTLFVNGQKQTLVTDINGTATFVVNFSLLMLGKRSIVVYVAEGDYYIDNQTTLTLEVTFPSWLAILIFVLVSIIVAVIVTYFKVRARAHGT